MWPFSSKASTSSSVTMDSAAGFMINSFVFLDLETSHLDSCDRPTIIEMSLFAVHRTGLLHPHVLTSVNHARNGDATYDLSMISFPRVVDKLTLCLNPRKQTSSETFRITKLDNLNLGESKKMKLDEDVISMLKIFLSRQESPICLVAHNGNKFDYRVLRTELSRLTEDEPFTDLYCADSWVGFRDDFATNFSNTQTFSLKRKLPDRETSRESFPQKRGLAESTTSPDSNGVGSSSADASIAAVSGSNSTAACSTLALSSSSIQPLISGDPCISTKPQDPVPLHSDPIENHPCNSSSNTPKQNSASAVNIPWRSSDNTAQPMSTSADSKPCNSNDNTPQHQSTSAKNNPYDTSDSTFQETFSKHPSPPPPPRKTNQQYHSSGGKPQKISYSLIKIFQRTFGREPLNSHSAEDDVASLINVLLPRVEEFVNWADMNATQYKDVELYYKPRKTRRKLIDE